MRWVCLLCLFSAWANGQSYPIRHYATNDGLISNIVYDAIQDKEGYMWFATNTGISKFDGRVWKNYTVDDGLADNEILKIRKDFKNRIWLFCFNGSLNVMEGKKIHSPKNHKLLRELGYGQFFRSFYANTNDSIWVYNNTNNPSVIKWPESISQLKDNQQIIVYQHNKGKVILSREHIYPIPTAAATQLRLTSFVFKSWTLTEAGDLMAFNQDKILKIDKAGNHSVFEMESAPAKPVIDFYCKDDSSLWIAADKQGVFHYLREGNQYILKETLLTDNYITSTTIDKEGNHWFTSYGSGIYMLPHNYNTTLHYSEKNGLFESNTFAVCVDPQQQIWAGHKFEYLDIIGKKYTQHFQLTQDNVTLGRIGKIRNHPSGCMLISTDEGFLVYDPKRPGKMKKVFLEMENKPALSEQPIKDFAVDSRGNIYIASQVYIHILKSDQLKDVTLIAKNLNLPPKRFFSVAVDEKDQLWIGAIDGLFIYGHQKITHLPSINASLSNRIEQMAFVEEDLLLSIMGFGILVIHDQKVADHITTEDGLLSNHCTKFFVYNRELYVCSNKGLNKITKNMSGKWVVSQPSTALMNGPQQVNDVFVNEHSIYAASLNGIYVFDRHSTNELPLTPPNIYLTDIIYKGKPTDLQKPLKLPYSDRHVTFSFSAPTFSTPHSLQYEYKINTGGWQSLAFPQLELNALVPGRYLLQVRVRQHKGQWSRVIQYQFEVQRPFYLSWWFYTLLGGGILTSLYINYVNKIKKLKTEQQTKLNYEQEINRLQLKSLQAMINPHFVFNSLSAIQQEINAGNSRKANSYLTRFSRLLRKNLENINESFITLDEEIQVLTLYLETEKMRMEFKLNYEIAVDPELDTQNTWIPTMLLQPIVENAVWHGIAPSDNEGKLQVKFELSEGCLKVTIDDNGIGFDKSQTQKSTGTLKGKSLGMNITKERLKFLEQKTGSPITFEIIDKSEENSNGTRVIITMSADM